MLSTTIYWINAKNILPIESGWYMVVLIPVNYEDFKDNPKEMNEWIKKFGLQRLWFNNGEFWESHKIITNRVIYWGNIPKDNIPLF